MKELIPKQTAAHDTVYFYFRSDNPQHMQASLVVDGDLASNEITVEYANEATPPVTTAAYDSGGDLLVLSATNPSIPIYAACRVAITKGITTNAVGVNIAGVS